MTPLTSLYVATRKEAERKEDKPTAELSAEELERQRLEQQTRWRPWGLLGGGILTKYEASNTMSLTAGVREQESKADLASAPASENKKGGTGTRAKGEEGSTRAKKRYSVASSEGGPSSARSRALQEAQDFGMVGLVEKAKGQAAKGEPSSAGDSDLPLSAVTEEEAPTDKAPLNSNATDARATASAKMAKPMPGAARKSGSGAVRDMAYDAPSPREGIGHGSIGTGQGFGSGRAAAPPSAPAQIQARPRGRLSGSHRPPQPAAPSKDTSEVIKPEVTKPEVTKPEVTKPVTLAPIAQLSHEIAPCSPASDLPLDERRKLWRERLNGCNTAAEAREFYRAVIQSCEAPGWYERQLLLYAMVDRLQTVEEQVRLYRTFLSSPDYAAVIYRAILVRIQDAESVRRFEAAFGIRNAGSELVKSVLLRAQDPKSRIGLLLGLLAQWPNDLELQLQLLDAYEDAGEFGAARSLARRLRRRADATSHVRTMVGEFYWRCSERDRPTKAAGEAPNFEEARRTFGEIVEFAPEDPAARRRLGDLLRAHGWYDEALRQYETLRDLLPDDPTVHLLIAAASQGIGKTEEALRWTEKAAATGAPDAENELEAAAQAFGALCLAWARSDALRAGNQTDAERLLLRGRNLVPANQLGDGQIRFVLSWEHPELRPTLYGVTNVGAIPARQMPGLGLAEQLASKEEPRVEIRLEPEEALRIARLGAEVRLTAIVAAGTPQQQSAAIRTRFGDLKHPRPILRFAYVDGSLREEAL